MKIAYLLLAHNNPEILIRLAKKLTEGTENTVFAHVDQKADITPFLAAKNVHFITDRQTIHWAGFSSVKAEVALIRAALKTGDFDRFVFLQMPSYTAMSNVDIEKFFDDPQKEYITALNVTDCKEKNQLRKFRCPWYKDTNSLFIKALDKVKAGLFRFRIVFYVRKLTITIDGKECPIWCGWAHMALTREATEYLVNFYDAHPDVNAYFKTVFAPDESYIHTVLFNSPFREHCLPVSHQRECACAILYFEYPKEVHTFEISEYDRIQQSGLPFFRKVDERSGELLDLIDSQTGNSENVLSESEADHSAD